MVFNSKIILKLMSILFVISIAICEPEDWKEIETIAHIKANSNLYAAVCNCPTLPFSGTVLVLIIIIIAVVMLVILGFLHDCFFSFFWIHKKARRPKVSSEGALSSKEAVVVDMQDEMHAYVNTQVMAPS